MALTATATATATPTPTNAFGFLFRFTTFGDHHFHLEYQSFQGLGGDGEWWGW